MKKLFGTDGVRGLANQAPMTPELAMALGQAIAHHFKHEKSTHRIIIGKDTRLSSYMLEQAMAAGICAMGSTAVFTGPLPTPGVAFLTKAMRADAGVMISASHNPFHDNGIKFFDRDGFKLSDDVELQLERFIETDLPHFQRPTGENIGKAYRIDDAQGRYSEWVKQTFPKSLALDGLKIVVDCANGSAYKIAPNLLWELGADVIPIAVQPNGTNINQKCGAVYPEELCRQVVAHKADLGIALDGDADRVVMCDEHGQVVDGDQVIALCALEMQTAGLLPCQKVVGTILTNMGVEVLLRTHGIELLRTAVGDRYIIEVMRRENIRLGGEPSGHVIFADHTTTGDGLIAALQILASLMKTNTSLSKLVSGIPLYPQVQKNIFVKKRQPLKDIPELQKALQEAKERLGNEGRTVLRYSGTEPLLRLMIEGRDQNTIQKELSLLVKVVEENLL